MQSSMQSNQCKEQFFANRLDWDRWWLEFCSTSFYPPWPTSRVHFHVHLFLSPLLGHMAPTQPNLFHFLINSLTTRPPHSHPPTHIPHTILKLFTLPLCIPPPPPILSTFGPPVSQHTYAPAAYTRSTTTSHPTFITRNGHIPFPSINTSASYSTGRTEEHEPSQEKYTYQNL